MAYNRNTPRGPALARVEPDVQFLRAAANEGSFESGMGKHELVLASIINADWAVEKHSALLVTNHEEQIP